MLNPAPVTVAWLTVTLLLLELVSVADCVWVAPTWTLPKLRLEGETASCPVAIPEPEIGTVSVVATELCVPTEPCPFFLPLPLANMDMLPTTETVPLALPLADGVKLTVSIELCPGTSVKGNIKPLILKPLPLTVAWLMLTLEPPELVSVAD